MRLAFPKARPLRAIFTTKAQEKALSRLFYNVVNIWTEAARDRILPAYARTLSEMTNDSIEDIERIVQAADDGAVRAIFDFKWLFDGWFSNLVNWHTKRFANNLQYATDLNLESVIGPLPQDTAYNVIARNVALVKSVSGETRDKIAEIVLRGLQNRTPPRDVAREIAKATGLAKKRSLRIASDQLNKISSTLDEQRMQSLGMEEFIWKHSGKVHYRPWHKARDGKKFRFDDPKLKGDLPGQAIFCFPESHPIIVHDDILMAWRRSYSGDLTKIITDSGEIVSSTPNHPILTNSGWKAAKSVEIGDYVFDVHPHGFGVFDMEIKQGQTRIGDLFNASASLFGFVSINGSGSEFHGDAAINEKIDIVDTKGGLRHNIKALVSQDDVHLFLKKAIGETDGLASFAAIDTLRDASNPANTSLVSGLRLVESLLTRELTPLHDSSFTGASDAHAMVLKALYESWSRYAKFSVDGLRTFPGAIRFSGGQNIKLLSIIRGALDFICNETAPSAQSLAKIVAIDAQGFSGAGKSSGFVNKPQRIVEKFVSDFSGYVYNVQTVCNWYSAGSVAVHNCGCKMRGVLPDGD
jgi:SPP1 gp7 family putative phage head morphogenesis protein